MVRPRRVCLGMTHQTPEIHTTHHGHMPVPCKGAAHLNADGRTKTTSGVLHGQATPIGSLDPERAQVVIRSRREAKQPTAGSPFRCLQEEKP